MPVSRRCARRGRRRITSLAALAEISSGCRPHLDADSADEVRACFCSQTRRPRADCSSRARSRAIRSWASSPRHGPASRSRCGEAGRSPIAELLSRSRCGPTVYGGSFAEAMPASKTPNRMSAEATSRPAPPATAAARLTTAGDQRRPRCSPPRPRSAAQQLSAGRCRSGTARRAARGAAPPVGVLPARRPRRADRCNREPAPSSDSGVGEHREPAAALAADADEEIRHLAVRPSCQAGTAVSEISDRACTSRRPGRAAPRRPSRPRRDAAARPVTALCAAAGRGHRCRTPRAARSRRSSVRSA